MSKSVWKRSTGALVLCFIARSAHAEDTAPRRAEPASTVQADASRAQAAALFERGVREFESQDYGAAARTFLEVDASAPSTRALSNALAAARRAGLHLVVIEIVERSKSRPDLAPEAQKLFDRALADAAQNLARVEVRCEPAPCTVFLDGAPLTGPRYVEPGVHEAAAESRSTREARQLQCAAGANCVTDFVLKEKETVSLPATPSPSKADTGVESAAPTSAPRRPLPPWVFVAGAAATVGVLGVTVWSGLDTVSARDRHAPDLPAYDPDDIHSRARRTDFLLAGTAVLAGATAVVGLFFVDWNGPARASAVLLPGGGALFSAAREF